MTLSQLDRVTSSAGTRVHATGGRPRPPAGAVTSPNTRRWSQRTEVAMPQDGGLRPETARAVDAVVARTQARGRVPSLVAAAGRGGGVAQLPAAGSQVGRSLQFRIGTITNT